MPINLIDALGAAAAMAAIPMAALGLGGWSAGNSAGSHIVPVALTVEVGPGSFDYPLPGEFLVPGRSAAPVKARVEFDRPLRMMKYQVSFADYQRCVDAGGCRPPDAGPPPESAAVPVTGVNYFDASAYAAWYSRTTGRNWRLPTAAEWAYAAAERFAVKEAAPDSDPANPAVAWISRYRQEARASRTPDPDPRPQGSFGANGHGLMDMAGNVFEWTSTCLAGSNWGPAGTNAGEEAADCGTRIVEGRHRTYMASFIRDGRSGGCAVGSAPENLGFRLVRDESFTARLMDFGRKVREVLG